LIGKLQKRYFVINYDLRRIPNYTLSYFYSPTDKAPRQTYELKRAAVILAGGLSFRIEFDDGSSVVLVAESKDEMSIWVNSLEKIIAVATNRDRMILDRRNTNRQGSPGRNDGQGGNSSGDQPIYDENPLETLQTNPFQANQRRLPTLRVEIDSETIPPSSLQRRQFVEYFMSDVAKALRIHPKVIEVVSVKPAPSRVGMTLVEFDINLYLDPKQQSILAYRMNRGNNLEGGEDEEGGIDEELDAELDKERYKLLWTLHQMVGDQGSHLYQGMITNKIDSSYSKYLVDDIENNEGLELISPITAVQAIMNKYKDVQIGSSISYSHSNLLDSVLYRTNRSKLPGYHALHHLSEL
jgi:hypothetical protein